MALLVEVSPPVKRKVDDEYLGRLKSRKLTNTQPSKLNDHSIYSELQNDQREKILDDRPKRDVNIPPLPLLYRGFGQFLDSTNPAAQFCKLSSGRLRKEVDQLVTEVCNVGSGQQKILGFLADILFPGSYASFEYLLDDQSQRATDGHMLAPHGGPLFIVEYKRGMDTAEPQIASYFARLAEEAASQICRGWRQPTLGLIIRGDLRCPSPLSADATDPSVYRIIYLIPGSCDDRHASPNPPPQACISVHRQ